MTERKWIATPKNGKWDHRKYYEAKRYGFHVENDIAFKWSEDEPPTPWGCAVALDETGDQMIRKKQRNMEAVCYTCPHYQPYIAPRPPLLFEGECCRMPPDKDGERAQTNSGFTCGEHPDFFLTPRPPRHTASATT